MGTALVKMIGYIVAIVVVAVVISYAFIGDE